MQLDTWLKRTVAVRPSFPYTALGFLLAWNMLAFTGAVWVSSPDFDSVYRKQQYVLSNASFALTLLAIAAFAGKVGPFLAKSRSAVVGGVISCIGSAVIILVGPYFFGPALGLAAANALYYIGCIVAGIGNAFIVVKCADLYGSNLPRNIIVRSAQSLVAGVMLYFLAMGFPTWRFSGEGPLVMGTGAFVTLPLIAGLLASLSKYAPDAHPHELESRSETALPRPFWRMVLVVSFLSFVASLVSGYANSVTPLADSTLYASLIIILLIPVALAFLTFAVTYDPEKRSFGRIFTLILVITALAVALAPTAGRYYAPYYQMLPFAIYILTFCYRTLLFFVIFQRQQTASTVFGIGYGLFSLADSIGWLIGSLFLTDQPISVVVGVGVVLAFLSLAGSFVLFSAKDFDDLFEAVTEGHATLSSLMERRLESGVTPETRRGKFRMAIDIIADEFGLSRREKDVLRHLAMGHDATRIAEELGVSWNTVRTHTRNLYSKLDVHSKQELADLVDSYRNVT